MPPNLRPREPVGDGADGGHVGGDVVPGPPVTACRRLHQATILVEEGHGQPVDLELAHEGRLGGLGCDARHAVEPRVELVDAERVVEAHHGRAVLHRREEQGGSTGDAAGGGIGAHELGVGVLEQAQLTDQVVVVGVGDLGGVELVVTLVVVRDQAAQLFDPARRTARSARLAPIARIARSAGHARERTGRHTVAVGSSRGPSEAMGTSVAVATAAPTTASASAAS